MITSAIHTTRLTCKDRALHATYRDFPGNVRTVVANGRVRQLTHYYPYGLAWAETISPSHSLRKYSSKEFYTQSGYDTYNFEARQYHPAVPRFTTPDPLAEKFYDTGVYTYCSGNPIRFQDISGLYNLVNINLAFDPIDHIYGTIAFLPSDYGSDNELRLDYNALNKADQLSTPAIPYPLIKNRFTVSINGEEATIWKNVTIHHIWGLIHDSLKNPDILRMDINFKPFNENE